MWHLPAGEVWAQRVLQYPICLVVVSTDHARLYGVTTGRSTVELSGDGWAVGTMLQPAVGRLLWGAPVAELTDRHVDLSEVPDTAAAGLAAGSDAQVADPTSPPARSHAAAQAGATGLGELAVELGYTDQAHFTRDFTRVTGGPPGAYLADQ